MPQQLSDCSRAFPRQSETRHPMRKFAWLGRLLQAAPDPPRTSLPVRKVSACKRLRPASGALPALPAARLRSPVTDAPSPELQRMPTVTLAESEARFRALLEIATVGIVFFDDV